MTDADRDLFAHYVQRGAEPWNVSLEAAWLDYELRAFVVANTPTQRPLRACNIGIGVGLWDDWLGHFLAVPITSIDRDPEICRVFELRQRREGHPHPACVICGDVRYGALPASSFDLITVVGSTTREVADRVRLDRAIAAALAPRGTALICEVGTGEPPAGARVLGATWLACTQRTHAAT